jgi:putative membrane protein
LPYALHIATTTGIGKALQDSTKQEFEKPRWPKSVYEVGAEPDPRLTMANERTFLAWIRSSLALVAVGVAIQEFGIGNKSTLRIIAASALVLLGAMLSILSLRRWMMTERAMRLATPLPGLKIGAVITITSAAAAIVIIFLLLL